MKVDEMWCTLHTVDKKERLKLYDKISRLLAEKSQASPPTELKVNEPSSVSQLEQDLKGSTADKQVIIVNAAGLLLTSSYKGFFLPPQKKKITSAIVSLLKQKNADLSGKVFWCLSQMELTDVDRRMISDFIDGLDVIIQNGKNIVLMYEACCFLRRLVKEYRAELEKEIGVVSKYILFPVCHPASKIREVAYSTFMMFQSSLMKFQSKVSVNVVKLLKGSFQKDMLHLFDQKQEKYVLEIWCHLVTLLGKDLHTGSTVVNSLMEVIEKGFKSQSEDILKASFTAWSTIIHNFSLDIEILSAAKRLQLLLRPLKLNVKKYEGVFPAVCNTFWQLVVNLKNKLSSNFERVFIPLLEFCVSSPLKESSDQHLSPCVNPTAEVKSTYLLKTACDMLIRILDAGNSPDVFQSSELSSSSLVALEVPVQHLVIIRHFKMLVKATKIVMFNLGKDEDTEPLLGVLLKLLVNKISVVSDESCKDSVDAVSSLLSLVAETIENELCSPHLCLKTLDGFSRFPQKMLISHYYHLGNHSGVMHDNLSVSLMTLLLKPYILSVGNADFLHLEAFKRLACASITGTMSPLMYGQTFLSLIEADHIASVGDKLHMWSSVASSLVDVVKKTQEVNQGDSLENDFSCMYAALFYPVVHFMPPKVPQVLFRPSLKLWIQLYKLFVRNASLIPLVEENSICENFCHKLKTIVNELDLLDENYFESLCLMLQAVFESVNFNIKENSLQKKDGAIVDGLFLRQKPKPLGNLTSAVELVASLLTAFHKRYSNEEETKEAAKSKFTRFAKFIPCLDLAKTVISGITNSIMIPHVLKCLAEPLSLLVSGTKRSDTSQIIPKVESVWICALSNITEHYKGPYDSDFLIILSPVLESALNHSRRGMQEKCRQFWSKTFGHCETSLQYSDSLKQALMRARLILDTTRPPEVIEEIAITGSLTDSTDIVEVTKPVLKSPFFAKEVGSPQVHSENAKNKTPGSLKRRSCSSKVNINELPDEEFVRIQPDAEKPFTPKRRVKTRRSFLPAMYNELSQHSDVETCSQSFESSQPWDPSHPAKQDKEKDALQNDILVVNSESGQKDIPDETSLEIVASKPESITISESDSEEIVISSTAGSSEATKGIPKTTTDQDNESSSQADIDILIDDTEDISFAGQSVFQKIVSPVKETIEILDSDEVIPSSQNSSDVFRSPQCRRMSRLSLSFRKHQYQNVENSKPEQEQCETLEEPLESLEVEKSTAQSDHCYHASLSASECNNGVIPDNEVRESPPTIPAFSEKSVDLKDTLQRSVEYISEEEMQPNQDIVVEIAAIDLDENYVNHDSGVPGPCNSESSMNNNLIGNNSEPIVNSITGNATSEVVPDSDGENSDASNTGEQIKETACFNADVSVYSAPEVADNGKEGGAMANRELPEEVVEQTDSSAENHSEDQKKSEQAGEALLTESDSKASLDDPSASSEQKLEAHLQVGKKCRRSLVCKKSRSSARQLSRKSLPIVKIMTKDSANTHGCFQMNEDTVRSLSSSSIDDSCQKPSQTSDIPEKSANDAVEEQIQNNECAGEQQLRLDSEITTSDRARVAEKTKTQLIARNVPDKPGDHTSFTVSQKKPEDAIDQKGHPQRQAKKRHSSFSRETAKSCHGRKTRASLSQVIRPTDSVKSLRKRASSVAAVILHGNIEAITEETVTADECFVESDAFVDNESSHTSESNATRKSEKHCDSVSSSENLISDAGHHKQADSDGKTSYISDSNVKLAAAEQISNHERLLELPEHSEEGVGKRVSKRRSEKRLSSQSRTPAKQRVTSRKCKTSLVQDSGNTFHKEPYTTLNTEVLEASEEGTKGGSKDETLRSSGEQEQDNPISIPIIENLKDVPGNQTAGPSDQIATAALATPCEVNYSQERDSKEQTAVEEETCIQQDITEHMSVCYKINKSEADITDSCSGTCHPSPTEDECSEKAEVETLSNSSNSSFKPGAASTECGSITEHSDVVDMECTDSEVPCGTAVLFTGEEMQGDDLGCSSLGESSVETEHVPKAGENAVLSAVESECGLQIVSVTSGNDSSVLSAPEEISDKDEQNLGDGDDNAMVMRAKENSCEDLEISQDVSLNDNKPHCENVTENSDGKSSSAVGSESNEELPLCSEDQLPPQDSIKKQVEDSGRHVQSSSKENNDISVSNVEVNVHLNSASEYKQVIIRILDKISCEISADSRKHAAEKSSVSEIGSVVSEPCTENVMATVEPLLPASSEATTLPSMEPYAIAADDTAVPKSSNISENETKQPSIPTPETGSFEYIETDGDNKACNSGGDAPEAEDSENLLSSSKHLNGNGTEIGANEEVVSSLEASENQEAVRESNSSDSETEGGPEIQEYSSPSKTPTATDSKQCSEFHFASDIKKKRGSFPLYNSSTHFVTINSLSPKSKFVGRRFSDGGQHNSEKGDSNNSDNRSLKESGAEFIENEFEDDVRKSESCDNKENDAHSSTNSGGGHVLPASGSQKTSQPLYQSENQMDNFRRPSTSKSSSLVSPKKLVTVCVESTSANVFSDDDDFSDESLTMSPSRKTKKETSKRKKHQSQLHKKKIAIELDYTHEDKVETDSLGKLPSTCDSNKNTNDQTTAGTITKKSPQKIVPQLLESNCSIKQTPKATSLSSESTRGAKRRKNLTPIRSPIACRLRARKQDSEKLCSSKGHSKKLHKSKKVLIDKVQDMLISSVETLCQKTKEIISADFSKSSSFSDTQISDTETVAAFNKLGNTLLHPGGEHKDEKTSGSPDAALKGSPILHKITLSRAPLSRSHRILQAAQKQNAQNCDTAADKISSPSTVLAVISTNSSSPPKTGGGTPQNSNGSSPVASPGIRICGKRLSYPDVSVRTGILKRHSSSDENSVNNSQAKKVRFADPLVEERLIQANIIRSPRTGLRAVVGRRKKHLLPRTGNKKGPYGGMLGIPLTSCPQLLTCDAPIFSILANVMTELQLEDLECVIAQHEIKNLGHFCRLKGDGLEKMETAGLGFEDLLKAINHHFVEVQTSVINRIAFCEETELFTLESDKTTKSRRFISCTSDKCTYCIARKQLKGVADKSEIPADAVEGNVDETLTACEDVKNALLDVVTALSEKHDNKEFTTENNNIDSELSGNEIAVAEILCDDDTPELYPAETNAPNMSASDSDLPNTTPSENGTGLTSDHKKELLSAIQTIASADTGKLSSIPPIWLVKCMSNVSHALETCISKNASSFSE